MLISSTGHVKLTDFGLSKIDFRRDLELSDLINTSPNNCWLNARTPGQLLSLTSHLSFGSHDKKFMKEAVDTSQTELNPSDESKISGVSPFFSAEDINISLSLSNKFCKTTESSFSSYSTAEGSNASSNIYMTASSNDIKIQLDSDSDKENSSKSLNFFGMRSKNFSNLRCFEDSGISSRKGDASQNNNEISVDNFLNSRSIESDLSKSAMSDTSKMNDLHSPVRAGLRAFKRPTMKRKRTRTGQDDASAIENDNINHHTGLTQEIDCMDIGSSTPKKAKNNLQSPSVVNPVNNNIMNRVKSSPDDEIRISAINPNVIVSTPVSSQKITRNKKKNNMLRFALPHSSMEHQKKNDIIEYVKLTDDPAMSPINSNTSSRMNEITPKMLKTPFRTPKSVRRGRDIAASDERILGTPDYLAPEILLM
jgi:serine/threonine-protein kinase greatwall